MRTPNEHINDKREKKSKKDFLLTLLFMIPGFGIAWGLVKAIEKFQLNTFTTEDSLITTAVTNFFFPLAITSIAVLIIPTILLSLFSKHSKIPVKLFVKFLLPLCFICISVVYLSFFNYIDIGKHIITHDPFLPGEKREYLWEDIEGIVIDEDRRRRTTRKFDYYIYFKDGNYLDLWGDTRMNLEQLKQVDDIIRIKGIPKYIDVPPNIKLLMEIHGDDLETTQILQQIISE